MMFGNVVLRILKLQNCERVGSDTRRRSLSPLEYNRVWNEHLEDMCSSHTNKKSFAFTYELGS